MPKSERKTSASRSPFPLCAQFRKFACYDPDAQGKWRQRTLDKRVDDAYNMTTKLLRIKNKLKGDGDIRIGLQALLCELLDRGFVKRLSIQRIENMMRALFKFLIYLNDFDQDYERRNDHNDDRCHCRKNSRNEGCVNMNMIISAQSAAALTIPISLIFWCNVVVYIFHIFEESVLGEVFVVKVQQLYFNAYNWKMFAGFNAILLSVNIVAVLLFEGLKGAWVIIPLGLLFERMLNGVYHMVETIRTKAFSSGLLTSVIVWILGYLTIRYSILKAQIGPMYLISATVIGVFLAFMILCVFFISPLQKQLNRLFEKKATKQKQ